MTVRNIDGVKKVMNSVNLRQRSARVRQTQMVLLIRAAIIRNLQDAIGEKAKHFIVDVEASGLGIRISLKSKDSIGNYIYDGTKAHFIYSNEPMPIGNNRFARTVRHPGTKSEKEKIDEAVRRAVIQARAIGRLM